MRLVPDLLLQFLVPRPRCMVQGRLPVGVRVRDLGHGHGLVGLGLFGRRGRIRIRIQKILVIGPLERMMRVVKSGGYVGLDLFDLFLRVRGLDLGIGC